jgi:phenylacetate-CoA ligase
MHYGRKSHQFFYYHSPAVIRNIFASVYGWRQRKARYGEDYHNELKFLKESQWYPNDKLIEYQWSKTADFLQKAIQIIPAYNKNNNYKNKISFLKDKRLETLPILNKENVRKSIQKLYYPDLEKIPHRWSHTSGTTGKALVFPLSQCCFQREYAFRALHYSWSGVSLTGKDRIAFCAGHPVADPDQKNPPFWVCDKINNHLFLSSYHITDKNLKYYIEKLEKFNPKMLSRYPSSIYLLTLAYKKYGRGNLSLKSIYTASETLLDHQRTTIEDAFQCKVFVWYGNSEMCANIVECEQGELHLKLEHSYVEILDEQDNPVAPKGKGRLVCSGFGNIAFPLIRYDIGDEVILSENQKSKCGRGGILIDKVIGRVEDYILTPDGRYVGRLDHLFKDTVNIIEAQIQQDSIDEIIIRIVPRNKHSKNDEEKIKREARSRLGKQIKLSFDYVQCIDRSSNGKFRFVISNLEKKQLSTENKLCFN